MKNTLGYPNFEGDLSIKPSYNLNKWMEAMKNLYLEKYRGLDHKQAMEKITHDWTPVELQAFTQWLRYYEAGEHFKYKTAQFNHQANNYYVNDNISGYFIPNPIKNESEKLTTPTQPNIEQIKNTVVEEIKNDPLEKKKLVNSYKNKLISRIISLRKLFNDGMFEWDELEQVLNTLNQLENQIRSLKKISLSTTTYQDLFIRQANILQNQGFTRSADFIFKLGQNVPGMFNPSPSAVSAIDVKENNALTNETPNLEDDSLELFLENLDTAGLTEDENLIDDLIDQVELKNELDEDNEDELIVREAQIPPTNTPQATNLKPEVVEEVSAQPVANKPLTEKLEVKEQPVDALIDKALEGITIQDIINKLEEISIIFKNREINHQLSIVDLGLRKLNLSPLFVELAESSQKALESSNYIISRIETVIAKLRGSVQDVTIDLKSERPVSPEAAKVRENLEQQESKEKARKELRKKQQDQKLETPPVAPSTQPMKEEELEVELPETPATSPAAPPAPPKV